jgi:hypothetical protein
LSAPLRRARNGSRRLLRLRLAIGSMLDAADARVLRRPVATRARLAAPRCAAA